MRHAHTPGPWYTPDKGPSAPHYQAQIASEATGRTLAITYDDEGGYNARLIASAPELLDSLKLAIEVLHTKGESGIARHLDEIIHHATGRQAGKG